MKLFWSILSDIYSELHTAGIKIARPKILFNQPSKRLNCEYSQTIFADKDFTSEERLLILEALDDLHYFCNGLIKLEIIFDLDSNEKDFINNNCVLLKVDGDHPSIVESDEKLKSTTLGLCSYMSNDTRKLYLVSERLWNPVTFKTTVTHELGHFIGLDHTKKRSIMHKANSSNVLYPTHIDAVEMGKVWIINPNDFRYFKL
jgi:hypothetical protein